MKLRTRYTLIILAIVLAVAVLFTAVLRHTFQRSMQQVEEINTEVVHLMLLGELEQRTRMLAAMVGANLLNPLYEMDLKAIRAILASLQTDPEVQEVHIFTPGGKLVCGGQPSHIACQPKEIDPAWLAALADPQPITRRHPQEVELLMPLRLGQEALGGLRLTTGLRRIQAVTEATDTQFHLIVDETLERQRMVESGIIFLLLVGGMVLAMWAARHLTRPLDHLIFAAERLRDGEFSTPIRLDRPDELGTLSATLEEMRRNILSSYEKIHQQNKILLAREREMAHLESQKKVAEETTRARGLFLANMSHEIRTPMNGIMGMLDLALNTPLAPQTRDYLLQAKKSSRSLLRVINDILDFSKLAEGKIDLERLEFHLSELLDDAVVLFKQESASKEVELVVAMPPEETGILLGDPLRLQQILVNLVGNALKFTARGEILLRAAVLEQAEEWIHLHFSVQDTGVGIPEEKQDQLFSAFTQADESTTRKYGGTGLGLAICKQLVEQMGGTIWLESRPNQGSTFHFTVHLGHRPENRPPRTLPHALRALRVLIVDDNATVRTVYAGALRRFGLTARSVAGGKEALEALRSAAEAGTPYHLLFLDWRMPGMDGLEVATAIRDTPALNWAMPAPTPPEAGTPPPVLVLPKIVLTTAFGHLATQEEVDRMPLDGYLVKPVTDSHLLDIFLELFGQALPVSKNPLASVQDRTRLTQSLAGYRVLLVEDNPINRQVAEEVLRSVGMVVEVAEDGQEAVHKVATRQYDLVLMDIQMPNMDGYAATRAIRAANQWPNLPILAMTAHAMRDDHDKSLQAGMNDHITKPIDQNQLFAALLRWINPSEERVAAGVLLPDPPKELPVVEELPGIDLSAALARMNNNRRLLRAMLAEFIKNYAQASVQMTQFLQGKRQDDWQSAQRLAHGVKGVAGNLSAMPLYAAARDLEDAIHDNRREAWPELLRAFTEHLATVVHSILAWQEGGKP